MHAAAQSGSIWTAHDWETYFARDGFAVLPATLPGDLIDAVLTEWTSFMAVPCENQLPVDQPAAIFWRHVQGERKRTRPLQEFPALHSLALGTTATSIACQAARRCGCEGPIRLLETIVFNKPPQESGRLSWHQDVAYFPFTPQNQLALWIPLDPVDEENGALQYAVASHQRGLSSPVDLHTGQCIGEHAEPTLPSDPRSIGMNVVTMPAKPGDVLVHDGRTWHCSLPNRSSDRQRRAVSLRYLLGETRYTPRPGSAMSMQAQANVEPGDLIAGNAFPVVGP